MQSLIGKADLYFIVLDSLRYDAAIEALREGMTPAIQQHLPSGEWEKRLSPACFTWPAHHAFFSGFLPVPVEPGIHPRLFAAGFSGSETIRESTFTFSEAHLPAALAARGYRTVCIGGVGFFHKTNELSSVLPGYFQESYWEPRFGVTSPESPKHQINLALQILNDTRPDQKLFLFINISAIHQPSRIFSPEESSDSVRTQKAALAAVDRQLNRLFDALKKRGESLVILTSDHGTAFGEDGYEGHRHPHPVVMTVPYAHFTVNP
jgi:hypothetical protein